MRLFIFFIVFNLFVTKELFAQVSNHTLLIEKRTYFGYQPLEIPNEVTIKIYLDGIVEKNIFYLDPILNSEETVANLSDDEINHYMEIASKFNSLKLQLIDKSPEEPRCPDAPYTEYLVHFMNTETGFSDYQIIYEYSGCHDYVDPEYEDISLMIKNRLDFY